MFGVKGPILRGLRADVVYKPLYAGCIACYVGETTRHFSKHVREQLFSNRASNSLKHLQNFQ